MSITVDENAATTSELEVEEIEEVIAPKVALNHNATLISSSEEIELGAEELEAVIAPGTSAQHNETFLSDLVEACA